MFHTHTTVQSIPPMVQLPPTEIWGGDHTQNKHASVTQLNTRVIIWQQRSAGWYSAGVKMTECVLVPHQSKHSPSTVSQHQQYNLNLITKVQSTFCRHVQAEHFPNASCVLTILSSATLQSTALISTFPPFLSPLLSPLCLPLVSDYFFTLFHAFIRPLYFNHLQLVSLFFPLILSFSLFSIPLFYLSPPQCAW